MSATQPTEPYLLHVDDSESDRLIVGRIWKRITGATPRFAENGLELIKLLEACARGEETWPRLVLLDLNMPVMNGFEALVHLKTDERFRCVPVVMFSTSAQVEDARMCLQQRANGYIAKESDISALASTLGYTHRFWFEHAVLAA